MNTEEGEYLVGAYLKLIRECDFVDYNVRIPGGGLQGLNELDVVGIHFGSKTAYLCEVTTHIAGLKYGTNEQTVKRIAKKHANQKKYAAIHLKQFRPVFMFWSPYVPIGYLTSHLEHIEGLDLVINHDYTQKVKELQEKAHHEKHDTGNPVFRILQILGALRN